MKLKPFLHSLAVKVLSGILVSGIAISLCFTSVMAQGLYPSTLYGNYLLGGNNLSYYGSLTGGGINPLLGGYYGSPFSPATAYSPYYTSLLNSPSFTLNPSSSMVTPYSSMLNTYSPMVNPYSPMMNPYSSMMNPYSSMVNPYSSMMNPYSSMMNPYSSMMNPYNSYSSMMQQVYELYDYLNYSLQFYQLASKTPFLYMQDQTADYIGANLMNYASNIGVSPQESILYFIKDNVLSSGN